MGPCQSKKEKQSYDNNMDKDFHALPKKMFVVTDASQLTINKSDFISKNELTATLVQKLVEPVFTDDLPDLE
jgi:hypothetical protein